MGVDNYSWRMVGRGEEEETARLRARVAELEAVVLRQKGEITFHENAVHAEHHRSAQTRTELRLARARVEALEAGIRAVLHDKEGLDHSECTVALEKLDALLESPSDTSAEPPTGERST